MNDKTYVNISFQSSDLPSSVRTLLRAKILILLETIQPSNQLHLMKIGGYSKGTVSKILKDFEIERLITEKYRLYRLTDHGDKVISQLFLEVPVREWINKRIWQNKQQNILLRPKITKLDIENKA